MQSDMLSDVLSNDGPFVEFRLDAFLEGSVVERYNHERRSRPHFKRLQNGPKIPCKHRRVKNEKRGNNLLAAQERNGMPFLEKQAEQKGLVQWAP